MENVSKILDVASQALTVIVIVVGAFAFVFKQGISEWIKSRFSKAVGRELEAEKHKLTLELEAYKGSIVRELEQYRANIDIKRTIALKMADARLEALRILAYDLDRYWNECIAWTQLPQQTRQHTAAEYIEASKAVSNASRASEVFLPNELVAELAHAVRAGSELVSALPVGSTEVFELNDERIKSVSGKFAVALRKVKEQIHAAPAQLE